MTTTSPRAKASAGVIIVVVVIVITVINVIIIFVVIFANFDVLAKFFLAFDLITRFEDDP